MRNSFIAKAGESRGRAKISSGDAPSALTDQQCKELRALMDYRAWPLEKVMERFGIDKRTARRYATGVTKPLIYHCEKDLPEGV